MRVSKYKVIIKAFEDVISALESKTVVLNEENASTTNMGLMTQAIMNWNVEALHTHLSNNDYNHRTNHGFEYRHYDYSERRNWWQVWTVNFWAMGGNPKRNTILQKLEYYGGLERDDIADIERLNNPTINELFSKCELGTKEVPVYETKTREVIKPTFEKHSWSEEHFRKDWWGRLWGMKKTVVIDKDYETGSDVVEEEYQEQIDTEIVPVEKDSKDVEHVLTYFRLWKDYLQGELDMMDEERRAKKEERIKNSK